MSDTVFRLFLLLGLGVAVTQFLVGWQLLMLQQEFRVANAQRKMAIDQNVQIIANQGRILEQLVRLLGPSR